MKLGPIPIHHPHTYYWRFRHRLAKLWPEKSSFNGFTIYHTPDTMPYPASFLRHVAPREMYDLLSQMRGRGAIDAGACIGFYSLQFSRGFQHVYSFEPHPKNMQFLKRNLKVNNTRNVETFQCALGAENGRQNLWIKDHYKASSSLIANHLGQPLSESIPVKLCTLDSFFGSYQEPIDLMKVDVEGAEVQVLEGAMTLIKRDRPMLAIEVHSDPIGNPCTCQCCSLVKDLGYSILERRYHHVEAPDTKAVTIHWILAKPHA